MRSLEVMKSFYVNDRNESVRRECCHVSIIFAIVFTHFTPIDYRGAETLELNLVDV